jgi:hypothetical protein
MNRGQAYTKHLTGNVRSEVFMVVIMKNVVFRDIKTSSYFTGDTSRLCYRAQPVNAKESLMFSRQ